jgi:trans-aconitate methyltransferase
MYSKEYQDQLKELHTKKTFGVTNVIPPEVEESIDLFKPSSILDFGCGKGYVTDLLKENYPDMSVCGYDPGQEIYSSLPEKVDVIFSLDVLEHIEPDKLNETLLDLANRTRIGMYHLIACHPAKKCLPDGRNAHLIVESPEWWKNTIENVLGWTIVRDFVQEYTSQPKKGNPIHVIKYGLFLKNG